MSAVPAVRGDDSGIRPEPADAAREFLAREDVLLALDEWADAPRRPPRMVLLGGPGVGKSAIVRKWTDRRQAQHGPDDREWILSHKICPAQDPATIIQSLLEQCRFVIPDGQADATSLGDALELAAAGRRRIVVVLDAIDQATDPDRLRELLPASIPPNVRFLCSSRPQFEPNAGLGRPPEVACIDLDHSDWAASNEETCRAFWAAKRTEVDWLTQARVDEALRAGQGNMLYARQLWRLWDSQTSQEREQNAVPPNLDAVIDQFWRRVEALPGEMRRFIRDALGVLVLGREPLQMTQIAALAGWPDPTTSAPSEAARIAADTFDQELHATFLSAVRPILRCHDAAAYALYHGALADPLRRRVQRHIEALQRRMISVLLGWLTRNHRGAREYAERHLLEHCLDAADWTTAIDLCLRPEFCERWLRVVDPVLAADRVAHIADEAAEGPHKAKLRRLVRMLREQPGTWPAAIRVLLDGHGPPAPPPVLPPAGRLIVVATASPERLPPLESAKEQRLIKQAWANTSVKMDICPAAQLSDLRTALIPGPSILHVGCHGHKSGSLEFEFKADTASRPTLHHFIRLIRAHRNSLELVVFNTCDSYDLGQRLVDEGVRRVICMVGAIHDDSAIRFVGVLHACLASGYLLQDAYEEAREACAQVDPEDGERPQLVVADPSLRGRSLF